jgi:ubiquinone/menaquinone biosynthesis C-methylase UbiE
MTYYDDIADGYEELHGEEQGKKLALIKQHVLVQKSDRLLDVGCGSGLTTRAWECMRAGADPAGKLIEKAKASDPDGAYVVAPAEDLPFPDHSFDIVISITALQNFSDYKKGLQEIRRVGKDRFVLSFLKRSEKAPQLTQAIMTNFSVRRIIKEEKDIIFIC